MSDNMDIKGLSPTVNRSSSFYRGKLYIFEIFVIFLNLCKSYASLCACQTAFVNIYSRIKNAAQYFTFRIDWLVLLRYKSGAIRKTDFF